MNMDVKITTLIWHCTKNQKISFLDIEVEKYVQTSRPVS